MIHHVNALLSDLAGLNTDTVLMLPWQRLLLCRRAVLITLYAKGLPGGKAAQQNLADLLGSVLHTRTNLHVLCYMYYAEVDKLISNF